MNSLASGLWPQTHLRLLYSNQCRRLSSCCVWWWRQWKMFEFLSFFIYICNYFHSNFYMQGGREQLTDYNSTFTSRTTKTSHSDFYMYTSTQLYLENERCFAFFFLSFLYIFPIQFSATTTCEKDKYKWQIAIQPPHLGQQEQVTE